MSEVQQWEPARTTDPVFAPEGKSDDEIRQRILWCDKHVKGLQHLHGIYKARMGRMQPGEQKNALDQTVRRMTTRVLECQQEANRLRRWLKGDRQ